MPEVSIEPIEKVVNHDLQPQLDFWNDDLPLLERRSAHRPRPCPKRRAGARKRRDSNSSSQAGRSSNQELSHCGNVNEFSDALSAPSTLEVVQTGARPSEATDVAAEVDAALSGDGIDAHVQHASTEESLDADVLALAAQVSDDSDTEDVSVSHITDIQEPVRGDDASHGNGIIVPMSGGATSLEHMFHPSNGFFSIAQTPGTNLLQELGYRELHTALTLMRVIEERNMEQQILQNMLFASMGMDATFHNALEMSILDRQHVPSVPPASEKARNALPSVVVTKEDLLDDTTASCPICFEKFLPGMHATRIFCGHLFCTSCIWEWLSVANTCPVCRFELQTDNMDFEAARLERMQGRKACLRLGELNALSIPHLQRILAALGVPDADRNCTEKDDFIGMLRSHPSIEIRLDLADLCYEEKELKTLDLASLRSLMKRHNIMPPSVELGEKEAVAESLRRFKVAGMMHSGDAPAVGHCYKPGTQSMPTVLRSSSLAKCKADSKEDDFQLQPLDTPALHDLLTAEVCTNSSRRAQPHPNADLSRQNGGCRHGSALNSLDAAISSACNPPGSIACFPQPVPSTLGRDRAESSMRSLGAHEYHGDDPPHRAGSLTRCYRSLLRCLPLSAKAES
jgi:hypothetical protein